LWFSHTGTIRIGRGVTFSNLQASRIAAAEFLRDLWQYRLPDATPTQSPFLTAMATGPMCTNAFILAPLEIQSHRNHPHQYLVRVADCVVAIDI
jgi:hypothetical protein